MPQMENALPMLPGAAGGLCAWAAWGLALGFAARCSARCCRDGENDDASAIDP